MKRNVDQEMPMSSKKKYEHKFCDQWLSDPDFKHWLMKKTDEAGDFQPWCPVYKMRVCCSKTALVRHQESHSHKKAMQN